MINYKALDLSDTSPLLDYRLKESALLFEMFKNDLLLTQKQLETLWMDFSYEVKDLRWIDYTPEAKKEFIAYLILKSSGNDFGWLNWDQALLEAIKKNNL